MAGPIKPSEVSAKKTTLIPEKVFEVFNEMIAEVWDGHSSTVIQKQASARIASALGITVPEVYAEHYLDIEESYRDAGWSVKYDKPGYCETYEAFFVFSKKK